MNIDPRKGVKLKSRNYYKTRTALILEMHLGLDKTPIEISNILKLNPTSVSDCLDKFYKKPNNPVTITLQSKINIKT